MERGSRQRQIEVLPEWRSSVVGGDDDLRVVIEDLIQRLDGTATLEEALGRALLAGRDAELLVEAAELLERRGLLRFVDPSADLGIDARYAAQVQLFSTISSVNASSADGDGAAAQHALNTAHVLVAGLAPICEVLARLLGAASDATLHEFPAHEPASRESSRTQAIDVISSGVIDLAIVSAEATDITDLLALNEACIQHDTPLLAYRSSPMKFEIGPLVIPGETACYRCLVLRERSAAGVDDPELLASPTSAAGRLNFTVGADLLALEAVRWLGSLGEANRSRMWRFDLATGSTHVSPVLKLPRCPTCGVHRLFPDRRLWDE